MDDATRCGFPNHTAVTGYSYGCRCDRCRGGWADAAMRRRRGGRRVCATAGCGHYVQRGQGHHRYCSDECRPVEPSLAHAFTCAAPACHNVCMSSQREARYCSNQCKLVGKKIRKRGLHGVITQPHWVMSQPAAGPTLDQSAVMSGPILGPKLTDWPLFQPTSPPALRSTKPCESCGRSFTASAAKRFCSERCLRDPINDDDPSCCSVGFATCPDTGCGKLFAYDARIDRAVGCCANHSTRIQRRRRRRAERARKRNQVHEPYTLREIAERDGWRCHLCGGKVPDREYAARDKDATIDHLIPQSAGGDDTRVNVALAHNRCNWERGNQGLAQLRLAG